MEDDAPNPNATDLTANILQSVELPDSDEQPELLFDPNLPEEDFESLSFFTALNETTDANLNGSSFEAGVFTVDEKGQVGIDFLFDGGRYEGELAIFSLEEMENDDLNQPNGMQAFIQEAARRSLSDSQAGYVVISDSAEGARFSGFLGEGQDWNQGTYQGVQTFTMKPGDKFGLMLIPKGTVQQVFENPALEGARRPLFSMGTANPEDAFHLGQIADVNGEGSAFSFEDLGVNNRSDRDYNDLIFQIRGATGDAVDLDEVIDLASDWRKTELGQELNEYIQQDSFELGGETLETSGKVGVATPGKIYSSQIGGIDSVDSYLFSLGAENDFELRLEGLTAEVELQLLDRDGHLIASAANLDGSEIEISERLAGGATYSVQVRSDSQVSTTYELRLFANPTFEGITTEGSEAPVYAANSLFEGESLASIVDDGTGDGPADGTGDGALDFLPLSTVEENETASVSAATSSATTPDNTAANRLIGLDAIRTDSRFADLDGSGFAVAILDTGIVNDYHFFGADSNDDGDDIADRIVYQYDFVNDDEDAGDDNDHGSHVSSVVASQHSQYPGVVPGANIIHLKVLNRYGQGQVSNIEQALQWIAEHAEAHNIVSVNLSLGDQSNAVTAVSKYGLGDELAALAQQNVIVVAASGNHFFDIYKGKQGVAYPSADPNSLSVGAVWDRDLSVPQGWLSTFSAGDKSPEADRIASFSQRHPVLSDVFAPGTFIWGADKDGRSVRASGTSVATPYIAGIAVLAQQLAVQELGRRLSPDEFRSLLQGTGAAIQDDEDPDDGVPNTGFTFERIDAMALAEGILELAPPDLPDQLFQLQNTGPPI